MEININQPELEKAVANWLSSMFNKEITILNTAITGTRSGNGITMAVNIHIEGEPEPVINTPEPSYKEPEKEFEPVNLLPALSVEDNQLYTYILSLLAQNPLNKNKAEILDKLQYASPDVLAHLRKVAVANDWLNAYYKPVEDHNTPAPIGNALVFNQHEHVVESN